MNFGPSTLLFAIIWNMFFFVDKFISISAISAKWFHHRTHFSCSLFIQSKIFYDLITERFDVTIVVHKHFNVDLDTIKGPLESISIIAILNWSEPIVFRRYNKTHEFLSINSVKDF